MRALALLVASVLFVQPALSGEVADHLQRVSVTIGAGGGSGSGVTFVRDGVTYVWTAAHVVDGLRKTRTVIDSKSGTPRTVVEFTDAKVVKILNEDGRAVGRMEFDAEVIRFSDADNGDDLALLRVRKKGFSEDSVVFYLDKEIPAIGTPLFHVGSLLGQMGSNSMTSGIVSQHGRLIGKKVYDQSSCAAFPGSSGGGIFLTDGRYVAMLVRGAGETFTLAVPVRRMREWAESAGVLWAIDKNVPMPTEAEMKKLPIEDPGVEFSADRAAKIKPPADEPTPADADELGFLIR